MWNNGTKEITLDRRMAELVRRGLAALLPRLLKDESTAGCSWPAPPLGPLSRGQRLKLFEAVAVALIEPDARPSARTAYTDMAVLSIFHALSRTLAEEVKTLGRAGPTGEVVIEASHEAECNVVPGRFSDDEGVWTSFTEILRDRLIDGDICLRYEKALDDPKQAAKFRQTWDLPPGYFTYVPPDPSVQEERQAIEVLQRLIEN